MSVTPPKTTTLDKYGLTLGAWMALLHRQGGVCAVCKTVPSSGRLNVDHDHVPKWKKLPPEKRRLHVRGLLCYWCNKTLVSRGITIAKSQNVTAYLRAHEDRVVAHALAGVANGP